MATREQYDEFVGVWIANRSGMTFNSYHPEFVALQELGPDIIPFIFDGYDDGLSELYWNLLHQFGMSMEVPQEAQLNWPRLSETMNLNYAEHGDALEQWTFV